MLALSVAAVVAPCDVTLVDRAAVRHKAEHDLAHTPGCTHTRVRSDIADVAVAALPGPSKPGLLCAVGVCVCVFARVCV